MKLQILGFVNTIVLDDTLEVCTKSQRVLRRLHSKFSDVRAPLSGPLVTLAVVFFRQESSASVYINNKQPTMYRKPVELCSVVWSASTPSSEKSLRTTQDFVRCGS